MGKDDYYSPAAMAPEAATAPPCSGCDFCGEAVAVLHCPADSARLCLACDRVVHAANSVSSRHSRALLCDGCRCARAVILCASHRAVLCPNCDYEAHLAGGAGHDRRQLEPFSGCPVAAELAEILGVEGEEKGVEGDETVNGEEGWVWDVPEILRLEDYIVPTTTCHGFQALGMPPLNKNRKSTCGKHKEEIVRQLRELIKSETCMPNDLGQNESIIDFLSLEPEQCLQSGNLVSDIDHDTTCIMVPTCELNAVQWNNVDGHEASDPWAFSFEQIRGSTSNANPSGADRPVDTHANQVNDGGEEPGNLIIKDKNLSLPQRGGYDIILPDRDSVLSRYKEKRKTRRYDKLIRYESRKARADSRTRIRGRFAKANQAEQ